MKTRQPALRKWHGPVKVYLEDLERIVERLRELPDVTGVSVHADQDEYGSLQELVESYEDKKPRSLFFSPKTDEDKRSPWVSIGPHAAGVDFGSANASASGIFHQISRLLASRQRLLARWSLPLGIIELLALNLYVVFTVSGGGNRPVLQQVVENVTSVGAGVFIWVVVLRPLWTSDIRLVRRQEVSGFWELNRETITVLATGAVIAWALPYLVRLILGLLPRIT